MEAENKNKQCMERVVETQCPRTILRLTPVCLVADAPSSSTQQEDIGRLVASVKRKAKSKKS